MPHAVVDTTPQRVGSHLAKFGMLVPKVIYMTNVGAARKRTSSTIHMIKLRQRLVRNNRTITFYDHSAASHWSTKFLQFLLSRTPEFGVSQNTVSSNL